MNKNKKTWFFAVILAVLAVTVTAIVSLSSCGEEASVAEYTLNINSDGVCKGFETLSGTGDIHLVIPEGVVEIRASAFRDNRRIKTVRLPEGLKGIAEWTFYGCTELEEINVPKSVKAIGTNAFGGCTKATELKGGVYYIDNWVVDHRKGALALEVRSGTVGIADIAFKGSCAVSITLPDSLKVIGEKAFSESEIKEISIPDGTEFSGSSHFSYCKKLVKCRLPAELTKIPERCFYACVRLREINFPDNLTCIGSRAFCGCGLGEEDMWGRYYEGWLIDVSRSYKKDSIEVRKDVVGICDKLSDDFISSGPRYTFYVYCDTLRFCGKGNIIVYCGDE